MDQSRTARATWRWRVVRAVRSHLQSRRFPAETANVPSSLLALLDDIATVLDDVAVMTKVAAKKTAGVLGDEPSAQRAAGRRSLLRPRASAGPGGRKGSMLNKAILLRAALLLSAFVPWAVIPLMCSAVPSFASRAWRSWRTSSCTPRPSQSAKARSGQSRSCGTGATRTSFAGTPCSARADPDPLDRDRRGAATDL